MSLTEALKASGWANDVNVEITWIDSEILEKDKKYRTVLDEVDGLIGLPGFGSRGSEGKILAAGYAYETKIPYLGICFGMQMSVLALARRAGLAKATSTEFDSKAAEPVINTMEEQRGKENTGGTMRLGDYPCVLERGTLARKIYGTEHIVERHRHRYEVNNTYRDQYEEWGLKISGRSPDGSLVEMVEAIKHPFFVGTQAHPELRSRPNRPHPLYTAFSGVNREISRYKSAGPGPFGLADLADDDVTGFNFLTAPDFNAQALSLAVSVIFGGTAGFYMTHLIYFAFSNLNNCRATT
jgi:CTP synthase